MHIPSMHILSSKVEPPAYTLKQGWIIAPVAAWASSKRGLMSASEAAFHVKSAWLSATAMQRFADWACRYAGVWRDGVWIGGRTDEVVSLASHETGPSFEFICL